MEITCSQCGKSFDSEELISIKGKYVCGRCKNSLIRKIQEGSINISGFIYKGFWIRFIADLFDKFILFFLISFIYSTIFMFLNFSIYLAFMSYILILLPFLISLSYYVYFNGGINGATPGKLLIKAKIVNYDGSPISYKKALIRYFAEILSGLLLASGYIIAAYDYKKQTLHDRLCKTLVVKR